MSSVRHRSTVGGTPKQVSFEKNMIENVTNGMAANPSSWGSALLKTAVIVGLIGAIIFGAILPLIFRYSSTVRRGMVFMNYVNVPLFKNLSDPEGSFGLKCTRVLYHTTEDGMTLGMWHVLPSSRLEDCVSSRVPKIPEAVAFGDNRPVILYLHGNGGARGGPHRKELYKVLAYSILDTHVVAFDYRGYGDSTNVEPTAPGVISDATSVYKWLMTKVVKERIIVWGHSLGTAITTAFVAQLSPEIMPRAVILEAPVSSIKDAIAGHPLGALFRVLPYFDQCFVNPVVENVNTNFDSSSIIGKVTAPLMIMHAVDDGIVPYELGRKLYQTARENRPKSSQTPKFIPFQPHHGYGHKNIYRDEDLPQIIQNFIDTSAPSAS